jgi:hypothetical protein
MPNLNLMSKKRLILALYSSLVLILACVVVVTVFTAVTYAGTCSKLTGFPGLVQRLGFAGSSPCVSKIGGTVCNGGAACTTTDTKAPGTCKNIAAVGQAANCQCVANTVSPLR